MDKQTVHTNSLFKVDDKFDDSRFCRVRVAVMHSGINRNGSRFSKECIEAAKDTFANIPILADVREYTDENGNTHLDYSGHTMHIEENAFDSESQKMIYDEKVVGIIPETNNFEMVYDEETKNYYVNVDALLYREYGNYCVEILESRGGITDVSVEVACDEMSYSAKDKVLDVNKMTAMGVTLLGESVKPGMAKAHAEVFSSSEETRQEQLIEIMKELTFALNNYTNTTRKEEEQVADTQIIETMEDEVVLEEEVTEPAIEVEEVNEVTETPSEEVVLNEEENVEETVESPEETVIENSLTYSLSVDGEVKTYSVSLADKMNAISVLVNDTYSELDNDWYYCDVYEEESYVVMHGWSGSYRQSFKCKKDKYSLVGDRVRVYAQYLTEDEISALESMKSKYSEIEEKLGKYEAEPKKMEVLESEDYVQIRDTEAFAELKEQKNHFDLSVDEVAKKADELLLAYAKNTKLEFSVKPEEPKNNASFVMFGTSERNGSSFLDNLLNK